MDMNWIDEIRDPEPRKRYTWPWSPGTWNSRSDARPSNGTSMPG